MIRVAVVGANGKMGKDLIDLIESDDNFTVAAAVARAKTDKTIRLKDLKADDIDGVIDFSVAENIGEVLETCARLKKPAVIATTGFQTSPQAVLEKAALSIPVLWSPNMSLGIAYLQMAISHLNLLKGFDFQIEEVHHTKKRDAPSGTGLFLQTALKQAVDREPPPVISIRAGNIFGIHKVMGFGPEETVTLEHQALNRRVFSRGSLSALKWLVHQPPKLYMMADIFR